jgi:tetratricopeptide (TPR) repeat protein
MRSFEKSVFRPLGAVLAVATLGASTAMSAIHTSIPAYRLDVGTARTVEQDLREELAKAGDDPFALHDLGTVLYRQGQEGQARQLWDRAAALNPDLAAAEVELVFVKIDAQDLAGAKADLAALQRSRSSDPHVHLAEGQLAMAIGDPAAARVAFDKAASLAPRSVAVNLARGRFLQVTGERALGRQSFEVAAQAAPDQPTGWLMLAADDFEEYRIEKCLENLRRAESSRAGQPLAEARLAEFYLQIADYPLAYHWFRAAYDRRPEDKLVACRTAQMLIALNRSVEARAILQAVLKREEYVPALVTLSQLEESSGNPELAAALLERVLKQDPRNLIANNNLAMLLVQTKQSPERALSLASQAMQVQETVEVASTFGCALVHAGEFERAIDYLKRCVRDRPSDVWTRYYYGLALEKLGQQERAGEQFSACLLLDDDFPYRKEMEKLAARK